jgi:DNA-binding XRE family transcriptional regulator
LLTKRRSLHRLYVDIAFEMSSLTIKESSRISTAIRTLRDKLGETQAGMARLLGASLRTYDRWEAGDTIPRGHIVVKIMDLCPDDQTRSHFYAAGGLNESKASGKRLASSSPRRGSPEDRLRMRFRNSCLEAIEIIYESAVLGSAAADEKLRSYADELNRNAVILATGIVQHGKGAAN